MLNGATGPTADVLSAEDFASQVFAGTLDEGVASSVAGEGEQYVPRSPFTETLVAPTTSVGPEAGRTATAGTPTVTITSPFRSEYGDGPGTEASPRREAFETLTAELYDREFSEALEELVAEAEDARIERFGALALPAGEAEQFAAEYLAPLRDESESLFERLADQYANHDIAGASEAKIDELFASLTPSFGHLSPAFEDFIGGLVKKAGRLVKGAVNLAKKGIAAVGKVLPIGKIFSLIKRLVRPLLNRVLQFALGRLPASLQPAARKLAAQLLGTKEAEAEAAELEATPVTGLSAAAEADGLQREFDARTSALLLAPDGELEAELESEDETPGRDVEGGRLAELDTARERFVADIGQARTEHEVTAALENFLPAVWAALKVGVSIVGRQRIVDFLAKLLAQLVGKLVGPEVAGPLSQAIVSTGLGLAGLEAPAERSALAGEAVAATVEGTVRRLAEQGESVLTDQRLLEAAVGEAFGEAAAEAFPPSMIRESLRETTGPRAPTGTWILRPAQGPRRYKRYSQVLDVTVDAQSARTVRGFGGIPLAAFLRSRYGVDVPLRARAYLFETLPGTRLGVIARTERGVPGLGPGVRKGWRYFLPLTSATAGTLLGQPGLGRDVDPSFLRTGRRVSVGQRVLVLVPENRTTPGGAREVARASQLNLSLDLPRSSIGAFVHLTEADAQQVAGPLRRGESATPALALIRNVYVAAVNSMLSGDARRHVRIHGEVVAGEEFVGAALAKVGDVVLKKVAEKLVDWIGTAIAEFLARRSRELVTAADAPAQGVTIEVSIRHEQLVAVLRPLLAGRDAGGVPGPLAVARALLTPPVVTVRTHPGLVDRTTP